MITLRVLKLVQRPTISHYHTGHLEQPEPSRLVARVVRYDTPYPQDKRQPLVASMVKGVLAAPWDKIILHRSQGLQWMCSVEGAQRGAKGAPVGCETQLTRTVARFGATHRTGNWGAARSTHGAQRPTSANFIKTLVLVNVSKMQQMPNLYF